MLGHSQAVDDHGLIGLSIDPGGLDDILGSHAGDLGCFFRGILLHRLLQLLKAHGAPVYELPVLQPFSEDHIHHGIDQSDAGSRYLVKPDRGQADQLDLAGVGDDYLRPIPGRLDYLQADYGMSLGGIGADDEKNIGVFNLIEGVGGRSAAKAGSEPGHGWGVTDPGAVVHIVGAEDGPGQLLHQVVLLVGAAGRGERTQGIRAVFLFDLSEPPGYHLQGLIP